MAFNPPQLLPYHVPQWLMIYIINGKVATCQENNNLVLAKIPTQRPFICTGCIFNERKILIVYDIEMGLAFHIPIINIVLTFQSRLNDINVCNQPCFVHICCYKSLDNLVLYEFTFFHLCLMHVVLCHNCNEPPCQPINVMSLAAFYIKRESMLQCPMVRF